MNSRFSGLLVPFTAWVMAAVLACKIAALVQMAWADDKPAPSQAVPAASAAQTLPQPSSSDATSPTPVAAATLAAVPKAATGEPRPAGVSTAVTSSAAIEPIRAPAAPPVPPDWKLLQDLREQRDTLDKRSAALDAREMAIDAAQHVLEQRLREIEHRQAELTSLESDRQTQEQAGLQGLVKLYEDMRPPEAAAIFDALDLHVLLPLLDKMNERKAAAIMGAMQPERARFATQALAKYRIERALGPNPASPNPS